MDQIAVALKELLQVVYNTNLEGLLDKDICIDNFTKAVNLWLMTTVPINIGDHTGTATIPSGVIPTSCKSQPTLIITPETLSLELKGLTLEETYETSSRKISQSFSNWILTGIVNTTLIPQPPVLSGQGVGSITEGITLYSQLLTILTQSADPDYDSMTEFCKLLSLWVSNLTWKTTDTVVVTGGSGTGVSIGDFN